MRKLHTLMGSLTFLLFLVHGIFMSLVLYGTIPYNSSYKYVGIVLAVTIGLHFVVSILSNMKAPVPASENPFHIQKIITGYIIILLFIFHFTNYKQVAASDFRRILAMISELLFIIICTLHTRFTVRGICYSLNIKDTAKLKKISYLACGIATAIILFMGIAVLKFFL